MSANRRVSTRKRVGDYRARLRAQGMRPIQVWVPDVRSAEFAEQARIQGLAAACSPSEREDQAFVDAITDWGE
jgi:hypothetical protein